MDPVARELWKKSLIWGGGIIGFGYLMFKFTTPTPEQLMARLSPDLRKDAEQNAALREEEQRQLMEIVKQTAASKDPIWKTGAIQSPWDADYKPTSESLLVQKERYERKLAEEVQKEDLEKKKKEVERTAKLEKMQKKGWWVG